VPRGDTGREGGWETGNDESERERERGEKMVMSIILRYYD